MQTPETNLKPRLRPVDPDSWPDLGFLYGVLIRRISEPDTNISHTRMPSWVEHCAFVKSKPYRRHDIICSGDLCIGVTYVDEDGGIGIYVSPEHRRHGVARWTLQQLLADWRETKTMHANINPRNLASQRLFTAAGFIFSAVHPAGVQVTFRREVDDQRREPAAAVD